MNDDKILLPVLHVDELGTSNCIFCIPDKPFVLIAVINKLSQISSKRFLVMITSYYKSISCRIPLNLEEESLSHHMES